MNNRPVLTAYLFLFISPAFFSTNVIFGRAAQSIEPFTLAALRWGLSAIVLLVLCRPYWSQMWSIFVQKPVLCLFQGFLAMWICGAVVYLALKHTSATNGTLIYTTPPVMIILIEAAFKGRKTSIRELSGVFLAFAGVLAILMKGSIDNLLALEFNPGDLLFVLAAISWSVYSVILKSDTFSGLPTIPLFALVASCGFLTLIPFAVGEFAVTGNFPSNSNQWQLIAGIVILASLISFSTFQYGIKVVGASIAGIFMYLLPLYGITLAWYFLGENLETHHMAGIIMILLGVILATLPKRLFRRRASTT